MSTRHLRYALFSAVAAVAASVVGVTLYVAVEEFGAILVGVGFGFSLAPYGALLALPAGLLLSLLQPRVSKAPFVVVATTVALALGGILGWWVSAGSYILFQPISLFLAVTWAIAGGVLSVISHRSPLGGTEAQ